MTTFAADFWPIARGCRGRLSSGGRPKAEEKWDKAIKAKADPREIVAGWLGYQSAMNDTETDFLHRMMASTFLNKWMWEEYLDEGAAKAYLEQTRLRVVG